MTDSPFAHCSSADVFEAVTAHSDSDDTRSLWTRMRDEHRRKGVQSVGSYLDSEFTQGSATRDSNHLEG